MYTKSRNLYTNENKKQETISLNKIRLVGIGFKDKKQSYYLKLIIKFGKFYINSL